MTMPPSLVATTNTRFIARTILAEIEYDGADAVARHLPNVQPHQVPALIALLAKAATTGTLPPAPNGRPRMPLLLTVDERRRAHARWTAGARDRATIRGEREYQRESKRQRRELAS